MRLFTKLSIAVILISNLTLAYALSDESVLMPGSRVIAGNLSENEFFILAANQKSQTDKAMGEDAETSSKKVLPQIPTAMRELSHNEKLLQQFKAALKRIKSPTARKKEISNVKLVEHKSNKMNVTIHKTKSTLSIVSKKNLTLAVHKKNLGVKSINGKPATTDKTAFSHAKIPINRELYFNLHKKLALQVKPTKIITAKKSVNKNGIAYQNSLKSKHIMLA